MRLRSLVGAAGDGDGAGPGRSTSPTARTCAPRSAPSSARTRSVQELRDAGLDRRCSSGPTRTATSHSGWRCDDAGRTRPRAHDRPAVTRCGARPDRGTRVRRSAPRTRRCSPCPTSARPSGTGRTRPGSSRRSCSARTSRATSPTTSSSPTCSTPTTRPSATGTHASQRGLVSRPSRRGGRRATGRTSTHALDRLDHRRAHRRASAALIELGLHHEQQHQELLCMDITHVLSMHPFSPAYRCRPPTPGDVPELTWLGRTPGRRGRGRPRRRRRSRSTTRARATRRCCARSRSPTGWSPAASGSSSSTTAATAAPSCGCRTAGRPSAAQGWDAPLYWQRDDGTWTDFGLGGRHAGRPDRARVARQLVRGRRVRPVVGRPAADRGRVGGRRPDPARRGAHLDLDVLAPATRERVGRPRAVVRRAVAVDRVGLPPLPGLPSRQRARSASTTASSW